MLPGRDSKTKLFAPTIVLAPIDTFGIIVECDPILEFFPSSIGPFLLSIVEIVYS